MSVENPSFEILNQDERSLIQDNAEKIADMNLKLAEMDLENGNDSDAAYDRVIDACEESKKVQNAAGTETE